jgi:glycosyltransferase involved in cell wall biosynthesis
VPGRSISSLFLMEYAGGLSTHTRFLEQYLAADPRFASTVVRLPPYLLSGGGPRAPVLNRYGVDFKEWWMFQYKSVHSRFALRGVDPSRFGLVFIQTQTAGRMALELPKDIPVVVCIDATRKLMVHGESRYSPSPLFEPIYRLEKRIFERSNLVVSWSDWAANSVVRDYGIEPEKVRVVRNGIRITQARELPLSSATNHQIHLGFVGNDFIRKGGDLLLRVHQEHFADRAHLTLVTSQHVRSASLRNVSVRRNVPWDELVTQVMPSFDLFVFPTRFDYSPFAVIEAMAAGLPVIASNVGSIPEMVEDGVTGFLIEPDKAEQLIDRISWALDNRHRLPKIGEDARRSALAAYSADRTYPQLLNLLADVARPDS